MAELENYVAQLKTTVLEKSKSHTPPVLQLPKSVVFRGPGTGTAVRPEQADSQGNPLLRYPIRSLQFVGTIVKNKHISAYIMTPDNKVYSVNLGDVIGDSYGKITKINNDHIEILEQTNKLGKPTERIVTLLLKD